MAQDLDALENFVRFEAPCDAFVHEVSVKDGSVREGQKLLSLKSPQLQRIIARVGAMEEHLKIAERPFLDGRVDAEIKGIEKKFEFAKSAVEQNDFFLAKQKDKLEITIGPEHVAQAQMACLKAYSAQVDAMLSKDSAEKKKKDTVDKLAIAKNALAAHKEYLGSIQAALEIVAPRSGRFKVLVAKGSFVKKGHPVGRFDHE
jgi:biotin carboxyl carrier protein